MNMISKRINNLLSEYKCEFIKMKTVIKELQIKNGTLEEQLAYERQLRMKESQIDDSTKIEWVT